MASFRELCRIAGWRFGGFRCEPGVVSIIRNCSVILFKYCCFSPECSCVAEDLRASSRRSHTESKRMGSEEKAGPSRLVSIGPATRSIMARTFSRSLSRADHCTAWLTPSTFMESPLTTSRSLTHRHKAPSFGDWPRIRISARRTSASVYLLSVNAAVTREVRLASSEPD